MLSYFSYASNHRSVCVVIGFITESGATAINVSRDDHVCKKTNHDTAFAQKKQSITLQTFAELGQSPLFIHLPCKLEQLVHCG